MAKKVNKTVEFDSNLSHEQLQLITRLPENQRYIVDQDLILIETIVFQKDVVYSTTEINGTSFYRWWISPLDTEFNQLRQTINSHPEKSVDLFNYVFNDQWKALTNAIAFNITPLPNPRWQSDESISLIDSLWDEIKWEDYLNDIAAFVISKKIYNDKNKYGYIARVNTFLFPTDKIIKHADYYSQNLRTHQIDSFLISNQMPFSRKAINSMLILSYLASRQGEYVTLKQIADDTNIQIDFFKNTVNESSNSDNNNAMQKSFSCVKLEWLITHNLISLQYLGLPSIIKDDPNMVAIKITQHGINTLLLKCTNW